jgi:hypothetical protein
MGNGGIGRASTLILGFEQDVPATVLIAQFLLGFGHRHPLNSQSSDESGSDRAGTVDPVCGLLVVCPIENSEIGGPLLLMPCGRLSLLERRSRDERRDSRRPVL